MKLNIARKRIVVIIYILISIYLLFQIYKTISVPFWIDKRIERSKINLANSYQVDIDKYNSFPSEYFQGKLKTGMSISDAHQIMTNYLKVYNCTDNEIYEIYYFFEKNEDYSYIYELTYDKNYQLDEFTGSHPPSQTLGGHACTEGLIEHK